MAALVSQTNSAEWERDALALVGRSVQVVLPNPNDSGIVLAAILRHHYLHEPLQECIDDCDLDELSLDQTRIDAINAIKQATDVTLKDVKVPMDSLQCQQQLFRSLCTQVQYQANNCPCGEPTAIFAHALLALVESVPQLVSQAVAGGEDELCQQISFLTPVFQRVVAGKLFDHCRLHHNCCQSAQTHLTMAFFIIALESYATQCELYALGLVPYLVKSLRSTDLNCKTSALRLVWLALSAKIGPDDIETAYVHGLSPQVVPGKERAQVEGLLESGFVAIEEMMRLQRDDITLAEISVITQLATSAVLWPSTKPALLDRRLPWKLFSQLLVEVLRLPIINTTPFSEDRLLLPTKGCLQLDDLIPDAMCLLSALTGTFLNAMRLQGKEPEHFKDYILPLVMTTLQKHYQQPWGGILVLLLASFMGQLGKGVILKLKKEVPQESFQDAVWTGLNTDVMTRLLGKSDTDTRKNSKQMRGLCYAVLCNGYRPSTAQSRTIDTLLVAWHLTEAWLPGRVGHKAKLQMLQDWLKHNLPEHAWLEHMHKHWCQHQFVFEKDAPTPKQGDEAATSPSPKSAKSSVARAKPVVQEALALSNDGILSYYNPKTKKTDVVDRAVLQKVRENSGRPGDIHAFKRQLKFDKPLVEDQCAIVHKLFDAFVKHLTELKWNIFSGTPKTPVILAKFWACSGFEAISDTIAAVLLQARSRGIASTDCSELAALSSSHNKILEQKVMVGKVIDTCQSRLLSWSISSSQLLQTAKEAAAPRTCLNHPNGCPVPGSAAALSQPVIEAAAQPLALTQASSGVAVPAEPQASNSAVQTQPPPNAAAAAQPVAAGQSAQPVAPAAAAPVTRTEHLQARDARQKQLDVQYLALQAQQAQDEASQKGRLTKQQGVASTTKDEGATDADDFESLLPMYQPLVKQLKSLPDDSQMKLVKHVAAKNKLMGALQITNPGGHDLVNRLVSTKLPRAASHPQLGASMEQLALAYSLFTSASKVTEPESALHDATDSFRSLTPVQKSGMNELIKLVRDALLQAPAEAPAPTKGPVPGEHAARPPVTGAEALQALPASPTHTDQQVTDADANEPKPAKRMGAKERKKIAAAVKAQQGSTDAEAAVAPSPAPVKDKLADKQRQAATAAESSSTIAAHRPPPAVAVKGKAQLPTEPAAADDKGKRPMQPKAAAQPDAKRAKLQAPPAAPAATSDEPSTTTAADAEPQSVASPSHDAQLAAPDAAAGEDWIVAGGGKKRRGAAGREADAASPTGDSRAEPSDAAAGSDGSPVAQLETQPKLSRKAARRKAQDERKLKAQSQASSDASPTPINVGPAAAAPVVAAPEADQAAPLSAIHEEETAVDKVSLEVVASIFKAKLPVIPPTRTGVQRTQRRSSGDWQPEAREVLLNKPKPKSGLPRGFKPIEDMPSDIAAQGLAQQPKQNPVLKKLLPGKPQPRKKRAIAEAKSANADSADAGEAQGHKRMTDDEIVRELDANYTCPITQDLFSDPVTAADDCTYERTAIENWLKKAKTSPMTNLKLAHYELVPNTKVKASLQALLKQLSPGRHAAL